MATARPGLDQAPDPIEHAAPDVELAEAQLALGRPELAAAGDAYEAEAEADAGGAPEGDDDDFLDEAAVNGGDIAGAGGGGSGAGRGSSPGAGSGGLVPRRAAVPAPRPGMVGRLVGFLRGSWRELQRVQWPDRRQVMQATGVVIGFVIVAGVFLGVADVVASKVVTLILK
ncbi:MAG: preprotein translocase subunit SecE [Solirubrobacteraceae bacterium]